MGASKSVLRALRSIVGIFIGLMVVSFVAEGIEFLLVTLVNGSIPTEQDLYFEIRNQLPFLGAKFVYNGLAGLVGGYVAVWIVGRSWLVHGLVLAAVQLAGLIYGMTASEFAGSAPFWAWISFMVSTVPAIVVGAWLRQRRWEGSAPEGDDN